MWFWGFIVKSVFCRTVCCWGPSWTLWPATCPTPEPATWAPDQSNSSEFGCRDRKPYVVFIHCWGGMGRTCPRTRFFVQKEEMDLYFKKFLQNKILPQTVGVLIKSWSLFPMFSWNYKYVGGFSPRFFFSSVFIQKNKMKFSYFNLIYVSQQFTELIYPKLKIPSFLCPF